MLYPGVAASKFSGRCSRPGYRTAHRTHASQCTVPRKFHGVPAFISAAEAPGNWPSVLAALVWRIGDDSFAPVGARGFLSENRFRFGSRRPASFPTLLIIGQGFPVGKSSTFSTTILTVIDNSTLAVLEMGIPRARSGCPKGVASQAPSPHREPAQPQRPRRRVMKLYNSSGTSDVYVEGPDARQVRDQVSNAEGPPALPGYATGGVPISLEDD